MVVADGSVLKANESENSDLFWAVRGGGCNFGACTQFVLRLHDQRRTIYSGYLVFPEPLLEPLIEEVDMWWKKGPSEKEGMLLTFALGPAPDRHVRSIF